jgi:DNA polymerase-3 subunit delta
MADIGDLKTVYLIYGRQPLRLDQALHRLKARFKEVGDLDFNMQTFRGESSHAEDIIAACNTMPFMSERRLVVVRDVDKLSKPDLETLAAYARDPSETTTLVLVGEKVDKRTALYAAVDKLGGTAEYAAPKKSEFPAAVIEMFAAQGRSVGRDAAEMLVAAAGYDLARLSSEVDKVIAFAGEARTLSRDEIEDVMSSTASTSVYELLDALGSRDPRATLRHTAELLAHGESELYVHVMAVRRIRELIAASAYASRGVRDSRQLASALHRQDWQVRDFFRQAGKFAGGELPEALRDAAKAEAQMKTSRDSRLVLERWLLSVCGA